MSENLNVENARNYETRVKVVLVTDMTQADRQREIWNHSNMAERTLLGVSGLNVKEPLSSVVISAYGN